jgi:outer membrane protein TolC
MLIFDPTKRDVWSIRLEPTDAPPTTTTALDVETAVTAALKDRADLVRTRKEIDNAKLNVELSGNQRLPDVRLNASYQASGLGGTEVLRTGGFPGTIVGPGDVTGFASVLNQLFAHNYPTWTVGVSVSYPIGQSTEEANHARARLEATQSEQRLKASEARVIQQVREAARIVDMNAKRIDTTRAGRELAEQRLDAEQKRFEVGMSTSFLVIQAQRDLADAKSSELAAILSYDLSLVDFETVQQISPAAATTNPNSSASQTTTTVTSSTTGAVRPASTSATSGLPVGVF